MLILASVFLGLTVKFGYVMVSVANGGRLT